MIEAQYVPAEGDPPVSLVSLLTHFIPGATLPGPEDPNNPLTLRQLDFTAQPRYKTFTLSAEIDNVLSIGGDFSVKSLGLELDFAPQRRLEFKLTGRDGDFRRAALGFRGADEGRVEYRRAVGTDYARPDRQLERGAQAEGEHHGYYAR